MITATRWHDFSYGHRVAGHESKCAHLHGHNGRVHFTITGGLDSIGRIMDFSVINSRLCQWLEKNWDHKFLVYKEDFYRETLLGIDPGGVVVTHFNPTAESMAYHLLSEVGPRQLHGTGCHLIRVTLEETRKCSATVELPI